MTTNVFNDFVTNSNSEKVELYQFPVIPNPPIATYSQAIDPTLGGIVVDLRSLCLGCSGFGLSGVLLYVEFQHS
jgi:hypothetical protein